MHEATETLRPDAFVPLSYTFENEETVSGDFAFVGREWGYKDVKNGEGIFTDHPEIITDYMQRGVASLDDHIPKDEDLVVQILTTDVKNDPANPRNTSQGGTIKSLISSSKPHLYYCVWPGDHSGALCR